MVFVLSKRSTLFRALIDIFRAVVLYFLLMLILQTGWEWGPWSRGGVQLFFLPTITIVYSAAVAVSKFNERTFLFRTEIVAISFWLLIMYALYYTNSNFEPERIGNAKQLLYLVLYTLPIPIFCARFTLR